MDLRVRREVAGQPRRAGLLRAYPYEIRVHRDPPRALRYPSRARSFRREEQSSSRTRRLSSQYTSVGGRSSQPFGEPLHKAGEPVALVLQGVPSHGRKAAAAERLDLLFPVAAEGFEGGGVVARVVQAGRQAVLAE